MLVPPVGAAVLWQAGSTRHRCDRRRYKVVLAPLRGEGEGQRSRRIRNSRIVLWLTESWPKGRGSRPPRSLGPPLRSRRFSRARWAGAARGRRACAGERLPRVHAIRSAAPGTLGGGCARVLMPQILCEEASRGRQGRERRRASLCTPLRKLVPESHGT